MRAVRDHPKVTVRSANGVGKDWTASEIALWWLYTRYPAIVLTTAPTNRQVEEVIWGEIRRKWQGAKFPLGGRLLQTKIDLESKWYALGFSTDNESQFQGFHSEHMLIIFSEAQGIPKMIYEAAKGCLTGEKSRWLLIGNPLSPSGEFYNTFSDPTWHKIKISALDSPNYLAGKEILPGVVTKKWVDDRREEWGEDNPLYQARVLGEFPTEGDDTLIPLSWILQARGREIAVPGTRKVLGVDVARYGACETVCADFDGYRLKLPVIRKDRSLVDSAGDIMNYLRQSQELVRDGINQRIKDVDIFTDDIGLGGGLTDILQKEGYKVTGIMSNARANDDERFYDQRAEAYWTLREEFQRGTISIPEHDEKLVAQLAGLKYEYTTRGQIRLVSKEKMRKEGLESPDRADASALAVWGHRQGVRRGGRVDIKMPVFSGGRGGY